MNDQPGISLSEEDRAELDEAVRILLDFGDEEAVANQFGVTVLVLTDALAGKPVSQVDCQRLVPSKANLPLPASAPPGRLQVDAEMMSAFVGALFRDASPGGRVALRAFPEHGSGPPILQMFILGPDLAGLSAAAAALAQEAAASAVPMVFCPPIATFNPATATAAEPDLIEAYTLSVELDSDPDAGLTRLEALLGPATVVIASGGLLTTPATGHQCEKKHAHWRLTEPAKGDDHARLKQARRLATQIAGGDPSNIPLVHPIRWPGSLHRKAEPRLARILALRADIEIELGDALAALGDASAGAPASAIAAQRLADVLPPGGAEKMGANLRAIMSGQSYHDALLTVSAQLAGAGVAAAPSETILHAAMMAVPEPARDERWRQRYGDIPRTVESAQSKFGPARAAEKTTSDDLLSVRLFDPWREWLTPTFPLDTLPPVIRDFAEMQAASTGADVSACAMAALCVCSGALSHSFSLKMKRSGDWVVGPRLWVALIGSSSAMKSPVIRGALAPLRALDSELSSAHRKDMARWEAAKEADPKAEKPPPVLRLISNDTSTEKLGEILARQDRGILFVGDELSGWLGAMDKYSGGARGASADRAFWLEAYNGGEKHVDRIGRGEIFIEKCSVSMLGGIQLTKLQGLKDLASDGLLQRFLPVMMGNAGCSAEVDEALAPASYHDRVRFLVSMRPCQVIMDDAALDVTRGFQRFTHEMMQVESLGESFISFLGKLQGVHGSMMLLLHMLADPTNAPFSQVSRRTAEAAARILKEFAIPHAMALYQTSVDGVDWDYLRSLASYVLTSNKERFTVSDFTSGVHALRGLGVWHVQQKISPLVAGGWLVEEDTPGVVKAWAVVPELRNLMADRRKTEAERKAIAMQAYRDLSRGKAPDS